MRTRAYVAALVLLLSPEEADSASMEDVSERPSRGRIRGLVVGALLLAALAVLWSFADEEDHRGVGDELLRYTVGHGFGGGSEAVIYVWEDRSFAEYWVSVSLHEELDDAALLAMTPQNRGWVTDEMSRRLASAIGLAARGDVPPFAEECRRFDDGALYEFRLLGVSYVTCDGDGGALHEAKSVVDGILALDVDRPKWSVYQSLWDAQEVLDDSGGLVIGEVESVSSAGDTAEVELLVIERLAGQARLGESVTVEGSGLTEREREAVAGLVIGDLAWVIVDADGDGRSLAGLDDSGRLTDWGPSSSPFSLGHAAALQVVKGPIEAWTATCITHPGYASIDREFDLAGHSLQMSLQDQLVSRFDRSARAARRLANKEPTPPSATLQLDRGDSGLDYVIVEESGRLLQSVSGELTNRARHSATIAPLPGVDVRIYAIDLSVTGCDVEGNKKGELLRRGYLSAALGDLVVTLPSSWFEHRDEHDITVDIGLDTGMSWTDH